MKNLGPRSRVIPQMSSMLAFDAAARQGSFLRAAKELSLTPSAVSHQIARLEEKFGVRLFARAGRSVQLTFEGEQYHETVSLALSLLEEAGQNLYIRGHGGTEIFRISGLPFFTETVLIPSLGSLGQRLPNVTLHIEATHRYADFDGMGVDVAVRFGRQRSAGLRLTPLVEISREPVCSPHIVAAGLDDVGGLANQVLIHVVQHPNTWPAWLEEAGVGALQSKQDLWFDTVPAALAAAEQGLGIAMGMYPLIKLREGFGSRLVLPFSPHWQLTETIYLANRREQSGDRRIEIFQRWLIDILKPLENSSPLSGGKT